MQCEAVTQGMVGNRGRSPQSLVDYELSRDIVNFQVGRSLVSQNRAHLFKVFDIDGIRILKGNLD